MNMISLGLAVRAYVVVTENAMITISDDPEICLADRTNDIVLDQRFFFNCSFENLELVDMLNWNPLDFSLLRVFIFLRLLNLNEICIVRTGDR